MIQQPTISPALKVDLGQFADVYLSADASQVMHHLPDGTLLRVPASRYRGLPLAHPDRQRRLMVALRLAAFVLGCARVALLVWSRLAG